MPKPTKSIGAAIRAARESKSLSQERLAQSAGVTTNTVARIERGMQSPNMATVDKLAGAMGMTAKDLL
jgi:transcriptional regulator with XRE-family HTH domain